MSEVAISAAQTPAPIVAERMTATVPKVTSNPRAARRPARGGMVMVAGTPASERM